MYTICPWLNIEIKERDPRIVSWLFIIYVTFCFNGLVIAGGDDVVLEQAYQITKYGIGTISNVNYFGGTGNLPVPKFSGGKGMCGKTLRMELARGGRARIERMLAMCQFGRINPQKLVNHVMTGMDKIGDALLLMRDKTIPVIKIMVKYDE